MSIALADLWIRLLPAHRQAPPKLTKNVLIGPVPTLIPVSHKKWRLPLVSQRARIDAKTRGETIFPPRFGWCWLRAAGQGWSQGSEEEEEDKESEDRYKMPSNPGFYQQWHQHRTSRAPGPPACSHNGQYTLSKTKKSYIVRIFRKKNSI